MTTTTHLPNGEKGALASPAHLLLIAARNGGGFIARGEGASVVQLRAAARKGHLKLQIEHEGPRQIVTGATLTAAGLRHLEMLDAALSHKQHLDALLTRPIGA
jgi:hypothetical protein